MVVGDVTTLHIWFVMANFKLCCVSVADKGITSHFHHAIARKYQEIALLRSATASIRAAVPTSALPFLILVSSLIFLHRITA